MNYQRILSYLYDYDRGVKRKNIGFVKIDARGDRCRVCIHMKQPAQMPPEMLHVYFFLRQNDEILGVPVTCANPTGCECEIRTALSASFFENCGFAPADFSGIYIRREEDENLVYVSAWDDAPVYVETFREMTFRREPPEEKADRLTAHAPQQSPADDAEEAAADAVEETAAGAAEEVAADAVKETAAGAAKEAAADTVKEIDVAERGESKTEEKTEILPEEAGEDEETMPVRTPWEEIAKNFTKFLIKDGDTQAECLKIRPHHLALLPRKYWNDASNSFLLHGYYTYHHIILARCEPGETYLIGIPGKNRDRERVMADYYGYTKYLPAGGKKDGGYWCRKIQLESREEHGK